MHKLNCYFSLHGLRMAIWLPASDTAHPSVYEIELLIMYMLYYKVPYIQMIY